MSHRRRVPRVAEGQLFPVSRGSQYVAQSKQQVPRLRTNSTIIGGSHEESIVYRVIVVHPAPRGLLFRYISALPVIITVIVGKYTSLAVCVYFVVSPCFLD